MPSSPDEKSQQQDRYRRMLGLTLLLMVVVIWVSANYLMRAIFVEHDYDKPFFVTYVNTSCFSIYAAIRLFPPFLRKYVNRCRPDRYQEISDQEQEQERNKDELSVAETNERLNETGSIAVDEEIPDMMTHREIARLALTFCFLWFLANWSNNASLSLTNVASSTIISSTSCIFFLIPTHFTIVSIFGVVLVSLDASSSSSNDYRGDLLALTGAFCYGLYITFLKKHVPDDSRLDTLLFLGFVGLFNLSLLWPFFFLLSRTGLEVFTWPSGSIWGAVLVNALIGTVVSEYLWLKSMLLTSPLVATVGLSLTIPLAMVGDVVFKHVRVGWMVWVGAVCVITGFVVVNLAGVWSTWDKNVDEMVWRWICKLKQSCRLGSDDEER